MAEQKTEAASEVHERPDIYIGLVCAAGTDLSEVKKQIEAQLSTVGYRYVGVKVSGIISDLMDVSALNDEYLRMRHLMLAGDCLRENSENGQGVAGAIITAIRADRKSETLPSSAAY